MRSTAPSIKPTHALPRLGAALVIVLTLIGLVALPASTTAQRRAIDVLMLGSSSVEGPLGRQVVSHFEEAGLRVSRIGHRSTGLARPDFFDWQAQIPELGDLSTMRGVIVYVGGNDTGAIRLRPSESPDRGDASWIMWRDEERWRQVYVRRVTEFVQGLCDAGARRVVMLLPTDGDREGWSERIRRVQDAQLEGVQPTTCGVGIDSRGMLRAGSTLDGVHLGMRAARELLTRLGPPLLAAFTG